MFYAIAITTIRQVVAAVTPPPVVPFIWNLNTNKWNLETRVWSSELTWVDTATQWENELNTWN